MTADAPVRIGTRGSQLARWQAKRIAGLIETRIGLDSELVVIKTSGDRVQNVAFHKMEGKGFFTKELQEALTNGHVDLVVHSLKDLPTEEPDGLTVAAIPERANPADMLLARKAVLQPTIADPLGLPSGAVLGTSSLRRAAQALALRPDLRIEALRGNVPTRVRKLREGQYDSILVAAAGVERLELDLTDLDRLELPPELMLPAPAQGALAIETRTDDPLAAGLAEIHDPGVARCVSCERALLQMLGGGCHLPLGCLAHENKGSIRLQAALGDIDDEISRAEISRVAAVAPDPDVAARACHEALRLALPEVVAP
jgi:hydroxymethylbilane synthase